MLGKACVPGEPAGVTEFIVQHQERGAAAALHTHAGCPATGGDALVLGFAETATALGHSVAEALGVADYLQRAARHIASKTDVEQAYRVGQAAVKLALEGRNAVMPVIVRTSDRPYRWKIGVAPLDEVANRERRVPRDFVAADGFQITAAGRRYLAPLVAGEMPPPFRDGLPEYVRLRNAAVRKRLRTPFKA